MYRLHLFPCIALQMSKCFISHSKNGVSPVKTQSTPASHLLSLLKPSAVQYLLLHLVRMSWPLAGYYENKSKSQIRILAKHV